MQQSGAEVAGVGSVPLLDLRPRQADRLLFGGEKGFGRVAADGLDTATGHDAQTRLAGLGEQ